MRIGIIGGTGREGRGLALRWARAGHEVILGSREPARAKERARALGGSIEGGSNEDAAGAGEVCVLAVPYSAHADTLRGLAGALEGRVLVDITVPLRPPAVTVVHLPQGRAAALEAQVLLGPGVRVVAALHHVSATHLEHPERAIDSDVLVCADDEAARQLVIGLVHDLGLRGLDAGVLENAVALEALTPVLLYLSRTHKSSTGIRITGLPPPAASPRRG